MWERIGSAAGRWWAAMGRLWDQAQRRLDAVSGQPPRAWLAPIGRALLATVALVGLTRLLLTITAPGGPALRWFGAVVAALLALALLAVVTRNAVISLVQPDHRRLLLIAFLSSVSALALGVEAFSGVTLALGVAPGHGGGLWAAERFYLWQLVDSIPLLELTDRLRWTEPPLLGGVAGRVLVLAFTLLVIPPLARVGLAMYGFVENRQVERRYYLAVASRLRGGAVIHIDRSWPTTAVALAPTAAVVWAGWGHAAGWSLTSLAVAGLAIAVGVSAAFGMSLFQSLNDFVLLPVVIGSIGVVWFGPWFDDAGVFAKLGLTVVAWVVALIALFLFWTRPEVGETLVALALLLGFVGADAPGGRWLVAHVSWRLGELPVGPALSAAGAWLTVAFVAYLLVKAPQRRPWLGNAPFLSHTGALLHDLRGYLLIGAHVVLAAATALALLSAAGLTSALGAAGGLTTSSRALVAAAWHVLDSLPGPNIPDVLGWRLATDVSGRWSGLVIALAVAGVVVFALLPLIRIVVLWARLTATPPEAVQPAIALPQVTVDQLEAVIARLEASLPPADAPPARPLWRIASPHVDQFELAQRSTFERGLVEAELARPRLREVFGAGSAVYRSADRAIELTAAAYRTWAAGESVRLPRADLRPAVTQARAALTEFRAASADIRPAMSEPAEA